MASMLPKLFDNLERAFDKCVVVFCGTGFCIFLLVLFFLALVIFLGFANLGFDSTWRKNNVTIGDFLDTFDINVWLYGKKPGTTKRWDQRDWQ